MNIRFFILILLLLDLVVFGTSLLSLKLLIFFQDIGIVLVCLFSSYLAFRVARLYLPQDAIKRCWILFAIGFLFYSIGESFYIWYEGILEVPDAFPNPGDGFIVMGYLAFFCSFWRTICLSKQLCFIPPRYGLRLSVYAIIVFYLLIFGLIFYPALKNMDQSLWEKLSPQIYPVLDLIQFAFCIRLFFFFRFFGNSSLAKPWIILCISTILTLLTDLAYGYFSEFDSSTINHWINVLYILSYGSMGYAFQRQAEMLEDYNYLSVLD